jgi:hypothetical protein
MNGLVVLTIGEPKKNATQRHLTRWMPSRLRIVGTTEFERDAEFWLDPTWLGQSALRLR